MFEWLKRSRSLDERRDLQRQRAQARAERYAEPLDFPVQWNCGSPMPHLLVDDHRALLAFVFSEPDPAWYSAQRVVNSLWLRELQRINSVHERYNPARWRELNHYVFWFKDSTFECIARSFKVETYRESMKTLLGRMVERLLC